MNQVRLKWSAAIILAVTVWPAASAQAKFYQDVIRGFEVFGYRFSGQRNLVGDGWDVNATAFYNNREFDLGFADLTLNGSVVGSAGYTLRGIPAGHFSLTTGGTPLEYTYDINMGFQDGSFTGSILVNADTDINLLGFYDQTLQISNRASFDSNGFLGEHADVVDYDFGPINMSGNVYLDALAAVTQPFFDIAQADNPFAKLSSRSTRVASMTETADELRARIAAGEILSDEEMATLINNSILLGMLDPNQPVDPFRGLALARDPLGTNGGSPEVDAYLDNGTVPEPTTLVLFALALAGAGRRPRGATRLPR